MDNLPPIHQSKWLAPESTPKVRDADRKIFATKLRAAHAPVSVLSDFLQGKLSKHAAETWWATQPLMAEYMAERIRNTIDIASAYGRKFSPKEKYMYGLMTDPRAELVGRTKSYNLIQLLQNNYQAEEAQSPPAQQGGPPPPGDPKAVAGMNNAHSSGSAGLNKRLTER